MFWRNKRKIDFWWLSSDTRLFEKITLKALAFCPRLPNIHPRFSSFDWVLVHWFLGELLYFLTGNLRESCRHLFWKQKQKRNCVQCCHGNLVIPSIFAVIPLLRRNSDTINQSNLRDFSAYIIDISISVGVSVSFGVRDSVFFLFFIFYYY